MSERRGRILVVDDEPRMGKALQRLLAAAHEVTVAQSAREALEALIAEMLGPGS